MPTPRPGKDAIVKYFKGESKRLVYWRIQEIGLLENPRDWSTGESKRLVYWRIQEIDLLENPRDWSTGESKRLVYWRIQEIGLLFIHV
ncbi:hypothetical protein DPMN_018488 [Dreissena polymorpha]|uniref:Uncharacterized protein n=1 Tax=Dreissena polymorpha TaxID=45954 RepID=A0A9D4S989_DREPO|nr:hypothetical protein DPMN_018488 [Dreissena polymorpha]